MIPLTEIVYTLYSSWSIGEYLLIVHKISLAFKQNQFSQLESVTSLSIMNITVSLKRLLYLKGEVGSVRNRFHLVVFIKAIGQLKIMIIKDV